MTSSEIFQESSGSIISSLVSGSIIAQFHGFIILGLITKNLSFNHSNSGITNTKPV
jgi:hypothetical protein